MYSKGIIFQNMMLFLTPAKENIIMTKAKVFLVADDEENLTPMSETSYENEDILQLLLARYPDNSPND
jgi:hypothetical protein